MGAAPSLPAFTWDRPVRRVATVHEAGNFQKRHYEAVAGLLRSAPVDDDTRAKLANHFATHFEGDNPNFHRGYFVGAVTKKDAVIGRPSTY